jgi:F0F1-type ATP synthase membrane subunit a
MLKIQMTMQVMFLEPQQKNLNYELGLGFEFYLYYFKFSPSFRGIFSFQNELIPDEVGLASPWTGNIINMFSRGVSLIITFE